MSEGDEDRLIAELVRTKLPALVLFARLQTRSLPVITRAPNPTSFASAGTQRGQREYRIVPEPD